MKYIDEKVTIWNRYHFKEDTDMNKIIEVMKEEGINSIFDEELGFSEKEVLYETEEHLSIEENQGNSTVEVYDNNEMIYENKD